MTERRHISVDWGRLIHDLRREAGLSQRSLAAMTSLNRSTIRRFENGAATGDIPTLERVLDILGYELDVVLKTKKAA